MLPDPAWAWCRPDEPCGTGVLVVSGSSGRVDSGRAQLLSLGGATALAIRWFGGPGQQPGPFEVPLETFTDALDLLAPACDRLAIIGLSFGAEAALLVASLDPRVRAVVAFAPTSVVWPGWDGVGWRSHWTHRGKPLPYVPLVEYEPTERAPSFREQYVASLTAGDTSEAAIPVERIDAEVVLVAGGDDQVWPAVPFAEEIAARRRRHGLGTEVVTHPDAGHRTLLPGEPVVTGGQAMRRGGTEAADRALGVRAWPAVVRALRLHA